MSKETSEINAYTMFKDGLDKLEKQITRVEDRLSKKIDTLAATFVRKDVLNPVLKEVKGDIKDVKERVNTLEGKQQTHEKKLDRIYIIGGVISAIIMFLGPILNAIIFKLLGLTS